MLPCGRYITFFQQEGFENAEMLFYDTENDLEKALAFANYLLHKTNINEMKIKFISVFYLMNKNYDVISHDIELSLDSPFLN